MTYKLNKLDGLAGLQELEVTWIELASRLKSKGFTDSYYYYLAALRALGEAGNNISFFVLSLDGRPVQIVPLEAYTRRIFGFSFRVLRTPSSIYLPYWDAIVDVSAVPHDLFDEFLNLLNKEYAGKWHCLEFNGLLKDAGLFELITATQKTNILTYATLKYNVLRCRPVTEIRKALSKKVRANIRQATNRVKKLGDVEFVSHTDAESLPVALKTFLDLESSGWKSKENSSVKQNSQIHKFYNLLIGTYPDDQEGWCEIDELRVDGKPIASIVCLIMRKTMYAVKIGYDEDFSKVSPGILLFNWSIERYCGLEGFTHINFVSDTRWASSWKPAIVRTKSIEIYSPSLWGKLLRGVRWCKRSVTKKPIAD